MLLIAVMPTALSQKNCVTCFQNVLPKRALIGAATLIKLPLVDNEHKYTYLVAQHTSCQPSVNHFQPENSENIGLMKAKSTKTRWIHDALDP